MLPGICRTQAYGRSVWLLTFHTFVCYVFVSYPEGGLELPDITHHRDIRILSSYITIYQEQIDRHHPQLIAPSLALPRK